MYIWLFILIAYLPFQIALNPSANFDLASLRVFIILFFIIWLIKKLIFIINQENQLSIRDKLIDCFKFCYRLSIKNLQSISLSFFIILITISLIGAENVFWGARKIVFFLSIFPLYFLTYALIGKFDKFVLLIKRIISILVVSSSLIALIGLSQFLAQFTFGLEKVYEFWAWNIVPVFSGFNFGALILSYSSWLVNVSGQTILRAFSIFSDPHMFSFYLGMILPLAIILILLEKNRQKKVFFLVISFLLYFVSLLSFTRGAYFALIITFLVMAGIFWRYLKLKKPAFLIGLSLLIFIIPGTIFADRFYSSFDMTDGSNIGRLEMWQQASQTGLKNPWQGIGLGNYSLFVDANLGYRNPVSAHNLYLDLFSESGVFTLIIWLILILGTIWQMFSRIKNPGFFKDQALIRVGLIGSLFYFLVHSFFETAIYNPVILAVFMVVLAIAAVTNLKEKLDD